MYDLTIRYLASVFVDAQSISSNTTDVIQLQEILRQQTAIDWRPTSVAELTVQGPISRTGFNSADGLWHYVLLGNRFDISKQPATPDMTDLGEFSAFCTTAYPLLNAVLEHFGRKGHRLAAVQEGLLPVISVDDMNDIVRRIFVPAPTFSAPLPFEWVWRMASDVERSFGDEKEHTNTILTIARGMVEIRTLDGSEPTDRIRVDLDINTKPDNVAARFGSNEIRAFFNSVSSWHADFAEETSRFIRGE